MPVGFRIASAWVDIRAEDKGLREQVRAAVEKAVRGQDVKVPVTFNSTGLRKELDRAIKEATKGQKPTIPVSIDSKGLRKELNDALKRASSGQKFAVPVTIDSKGLRTELNRALRDAAAGKQATVPLHIDSKKLKEELVRAVTVASRGVKFTIPVHVDSKGLRRELIQTVKAAAAGQRITIPVSVDGNAIRNSIANATRGGRARVRVDVDEDAFLRSITKASDKSKARISLNVDDAAFRRSIMNATSDREVRILARAYLNENTFRRDLQRLGQNQSVTINARLNTAALNASLAARRANSSSMNVGINTNINTAALVAQLRTSARVAQAATPPINIRTNINNRNVLNAIQGMNHAMGSSGGMAHRWGVIMQAAIALVPPALAALVNGITSMGPAMAAIIPVATGAALALTTIMVGFKGVGKAIRAAGVGDLEKMQKAMENLSPAAKSFVLAIAGAQSAFRNLRLTTQEALFKGLGDQMRAMTGTVLPDLQIGLGGMAMQLNGMATGVFDTAQALSKMGTLKTMFGALQFALQPIVPIPGQFVNALVKMTIAAAPLMNRMTSSWASGMTTMTNALNRGFDNGRLMLSINKSGDAIVHFFSSIAHNPDFDAFIKRLQDNGPKMAQSFKTIAESLMRIVNALAPVSAVVMGVVTAIANVIKAIPLPVLTLFVAKLLAIKGVMIVIGIMDKLSLAFIAFRGVLAGLGSDLVIARAMGPRLMAMGMAAPGVMRTARGVGILGRALVVVGQVLLAKWVAQQITEPFLKADANVGKLTESLTKFAATGKLSGEGARVFGASWAQSVDGVDKQFGGLQKAIQGIAHAGTWDHIFNGFQKAVAWLNPGNSKLQDFHKTVDAVDQSLAKMVKDGHGDAAGAAFARLAAEANKSGTSTEKFRTLLPKYTAELKKAKDAAKLTADTLGVFGDRAMATSDKIKQLQKDTEGLTKSLFEMNGVNRNSIDAARDWETSADALAAAAKKRGINLHYENGVLTQNTQLQRDSAAALETHAANTEKSAMATYQATGSWNQANKILKDGKQALIDNASKMGMNATEAQNYANAVLNIPSQKEINIMVAGQAEKQLVDVAAAYRATPNSKTIMVNALNTAAIQALKDTGYQVKQLPDGRFQVTAKTAPAEASLQKLEQTKISDKTIKALADITSATLDIQRLQSRVDALKQKTPAELKANGGKLQAELNAKQKEIDALKQKRAVAIYAVDKTGPAVASALGHLNAVNDKNVTIRIKEVVVQHASSIVNGRVVRATGGIVKRAMGGSVRRYGHGSPGMVKGPGGPMDDKIPAMISNGEYVVRASAVKHFGVQFMDSLNKGQLPGFAVGGYTSTRGKGNKKQYKFQGHWYSYNGYQKAHSAAVAADKKAKAAATAEKDARSSLTGDVTFSHFGKMAAAQGSFKHNEFENNIGKPADIGSLVNSLNGYRSSIKAGTHGKTEANLLKQLDRVGKAELRHQQHLDKVNVALAGAKEKLANLKDSFDQLKTSIKDSIVSFGSITKIGKWGTSPTAMLDKLQADVKSSGDFAGQLAALKSKGVDPALIQQIAEAGITGGGAATAASVLNMTPEQLANLNDLQKQLTANAEAAGKTTADAMYGAGIKAAEGLVKGLTAQQKAIEDVMMAIAKSMEAAIKKALGIKSPSRVMMKVADFTADGLINQLKVRTADSQDAIRNLVTIPQQRTGGSASVIAPGFTRGNPGTMGSGSVISIGEIHVHIDGTFPLDSKADRRKLAVALVTEIKEEIRADDKKRR